MTTTTGFVDVPILGSAFFALGAWELTFGDAAAGARLLGYAERHAFSRMLPSFDWDWAASLADDNRLSAARAAVDGRRPAQLREEVGDLLTQLA
jgi:hypothetical protein